MFPLDKTVAIFAKRQQGWIRIELVAAQITNKTYRLIHVGIGLTFCPLSDTRYREKHRDCRGLTVRQSCYVTSKVASYDRAATFDEYFLSLGDTRHGHSNHRTANQINEGHNMPEGGRQRRSVLSNRIAHAYSAIHVGRSSLSLPLPCESRVQVGSLRLKQRHARLQRAAVRVRRLANGIITSTGETCVVDGSARAGMQGSGASGMGWYQNLWYALQRGWIVFPSFSDSRGCLRAEE